MSDGKKESAPIFGFLSVVDLDENSFCGGLLLLDRIGRPLEFHCTLPVTPNKAQEILYGRTLQSFVFCDQIGSALLAKTQRDLTALLVKPAELLDIQPSLPCPVLHPISTDEQEASHSYNQEAQMFQVEGVSFLSTSVLETQELVQRMEQFVHLPYIGEPFERIQEALAQAKVAA